MNDNANTADRYDPTGEAAIWLAAEKLVSEMKRDDAPDGWNQALTQASRALSNESRAVRQGVGGMYYRVITGQNYQTPTD